MCDYSLERQKSRPAAAGERLTSLRKGQVASVIQLPAKRRTTSCMQGEVLHPHDGEIVGS